MPTLAQKSHRRRSEGIISWEFQLSGENAAFIRCAFRALDEGFPKEEVVFGNGAGGYAVRWVLREGFVFVE